MLVDNLAKSGFIPADSTTIHRVLFFSNCLSPIYSEHAPSHYVMKHRRGPYYPQAQWDLDRLSAMGLLSLSDLRLESDRGGIWSISNYSMSESGAILVRDLKQFRRWASANEFLEDLSAAYSSLADEHTIAIEKKDPTYAKTGNSMGDVIDFSDWTDNYSARVTAAFTNITPRLEGLHGKHTLRMFMKYLERQAAA